MFRHQRSQATSEAVVEAICKKRKKQTFVFHISTVYVNGTEV